MEILLKLYYRINSYFTLYVVTLILLTSSYELCGQVKEFELEDTKLFEKIGMVTHPGMLQDREGFIWIYSAYGLMRYNGYEIKEYTSPYVDSLSIDDKTDSPFSIHTASHQYKTGDMWFLSENRLLKMDKKKNELIPIVATPETKLFNVPDGKVNTNSKPREALLNDNIFRIVADNDEIWLLFDKPGIYRLIIDQSSLDLPIGKIKEVHYYDGRDDEILSFNSTFHYVYENTDRQDSILWLKRRTGLYEFNKNNGSYKKYQVQPDSGYNHINNFYRSSTFIEDETFFLGSRGDGITIFDVKTKSLKRHEIPVEKLGFEKGDRNSFFLLTQCLFYDSILNKVWISALQRNAQQATLLFDVSTHTFERVEFKNGNSDGILSPAYINCLFQDKTGNKWLINDEGLFKGSILDYIFNNKSFGENLLREYTNLMSIHIGMTLPDGDSGVWLGGNNGLLYFSLITKKIEPYPLHDLNSIDFTQNSSEHKTLRGIFKDSRGTIWVSTLGDLYKFIPVNGKYQFVNSLPNIEYFLITNIVEDIKGNLWIHSLRNLFYYDPSEDTYVEYIFPEHEKSGNTYGFTIDKNNCIWMGNLNAETPSLFSFDPSKATEKEGKMIVEEYDSYNFRTSIPQIIDREGNLWCTSWSSGVFRIDVDTRKSTQFTKDDGLADNLANGVVEDENGNIWITTSKGLSRFDPKTETFRNFYESDGLLSDNFPINSSPSRNSKGELVFFTKKGVTYFNPGNISKNRTPPTIYFSGLEVLDKEISLSEKNSPLKVDISQTEELTLDYWQDVITFKFAAIHYDNPALNRYKVMLENYDEEWRDIGHERKARYANLSPGNYTFKVKAANSDGVWNEKGITLYITILTPPWQTWWAYSIYGCIVFGILYLARRQVVARERLRNNLKLERLELSKMQEVDQLKSEFFANVSHEFRTPLTLIKGPAQQLAEGIYEEEVKEKGNMVLRNTGRLLRLVNQLLDLSKLEASKMKLEASEQDLISYLKKVFSSFESVAEQRSITYMFHADVESYPLYFDNEKLEKVFINLLGNAFKFTPDGGNINLWVGIGIKDEDVTIKISDTGRGIPKDKLQMIFDRFYQVDTSQTKEYGGTGIGLSLTKQLVELHHGNISIESQEGKGTTFTMTLPKGKVHLKEEEVVSKIIVDPKNANDVLFETFDKKDIGNTTTREELPLLMIVDDNPDMRTYISDTLAEDFNVLIAPNGKEGLLLAKEKLPDLIISDVMMPVMDGLELCATLKQEIETSHIPIILLTAKAGEEAKLQGLGTGADDYVMKPFSPKELQARVENLIAQRKKLRDLFSSQKEIVAKKIAVTSTDERFLEQALSIMGKNVSDAEFGTKDFIDAMGMSRTGLHVKIKSLTGQSVSGFIRTYRLKHAAQLLEQDFGNIAQVAYESGFNGQPYFTKSFKELFGVTPKEYVANLEKK